MDPLDPQTPEPEPEPGPGPRVPLPLALLLTAAMIVGALAVFGEFEAARRAPSPQAARPARGDGRIMPGHRVDFITMGLPVERVEAALGRGKVRPKQDSVLYLFDEVGVHVAAHRGLVQSVLILNPNLTTADGIGVGADVDRVLRTFGEHYEYESRGPNEYTLHYWPQGIHFFVKETIVNRILVTEAVIQ